MTEKPFVVEFSATFMPLLQLQLGAGVKPKKFTVVAYSQMAKQWSSFEKLANGGWIHVLNRSDGAGEKPAFDESVKPDVVFIEYLPEYEAQLLAEVARCTLAQVDYVVVTTAIKTPPGEARRQLERFHERQQLCDFYIYLLNERGDLRSLVDELRRQMSVNKN